MILTLYYIWKNCAFFRDDLETTDDKSKCSTLVLFVMSFQFSSFGSSCASHHFSTRLWRGGCKWALPNRDTVCFSWIQVKQASVMRIRAWLKWKTARLKPNTGLFYWQRHMTRSWWYQPGNYGKGCCELVSRGYFAPCGLCGQNMDSRLFLCGSSTDLQITDSAHDKFPWKKSLCLWAVFCIWFSTPVPSAGPSVHDKTCNFHPAGNFLPLLRKCFYCVNPRTEESDWGQFRLWLVCGFVVIKKWFLLSIKRTPCVTFCASG